MKYIEFGIGETELSDGTEYEEKGIAGPLKPQSVNLRVWMRKTIVILDSKEGCKRSKKTRNAFKIILGMKSR